MPVPDTSGRERRKYVRVSANFTVRVKCRGTVITYPAAFARNISSGGIGIEIAGHYPDSYEMLTHATEPVQVEVDLPEGEVLEFSALVVWGHVEHQNPPQGEHFRIGMKFVDLDDAGKQKLSAFITKMVNAAVSEHARARTTRKTPPPGTTPTV